MNTKKTYQRENTTVRFYLGRVPVNDEVTMTMKDERKEENIPLQRLLSF